jgi:asparagine synthase (glutamine-hydrolysing)
MLGLVCRTGRPPSELSEFARLRAAAPGIEPVVLGPLAVAAAADVSQGRDAEVACIVDGVLYEPEAQARALGLEGAGAAQLVARTYLRSGAAGLTALRGRFATLLWNGEAGEGALTSDLLATHELFVSWTAAAMMFATEVRDLLSLLPSRPGPDPVGFGTWLGEGTCPEERTLYAGVSRLRAGHLVAFSRSSAQLRRYWQPRLQPPLAGSREQLAAGLRAQLERAVAKRLSPRASAVILSGGLDSSVVTAVAAAVKGPEAALRTYSAVFPGEAYDESAKIRQINARTGIAPGAIQIAPQGTLALALGYTARWHLPLIAAGSLIDIAATQAAAEDGAEVVLDGQTGDELFGLSPYLLADLVRRGRLLKAIALTDRWPIGRRTTLHNKVWLIKELGLKGAAPHRLGRAIQRRREQAETGPPWLVPALRRDFAAREDRWAWKLAGSGPMWWRYLADQLIDAPHRELRLEYLRHRAATESIVSEPPLYDVDLIEYCLSMPPELAFDRRFDRPMVRQAMCDLLPDEVRLQTQKADFTTFVERALVTADAPGVTRLFTARDALVGEYADMAWVRDSWSRVAGGQHHPQWLAPLWRVAAAEVWLRSQADPDFSDATLARSDVLAPSVRRVDLG